MSSIPKTTKFTLKRIIENLDNIHKNGFGEEVQRLTPEQKNKLQEMASTFENYGQCLQNEEALMNSAKGLSELCQLAELYALNECPDAFQRNIVEKDMKELKKRVMEHSKIANECYARMQQLGVSYQDIGHILGRYYNLKKAKSLDQDYTKPTSGKQPIQTEDLNRICSWCNKKMGSTPSEQNGDSHGICPECLDKLKGDMSPEMQTAFNKPVQNPTTKIDKSF
jgi:hypothetical protein